MTKKRKPRARPLRSSQPQPALRKSGKESLGEEKATQAGGTESQEQEAAGQPASRTVVVAGSVLFVVFVWSYWPTFAYLLERWYNVADYSHGYLVIPLALGFMWMRRDSLPKPSKGVGWAALIFLMIGLSLRILSAIYYLPPVDGWSIPFWLAGASLLFGGPRFFRWCLPSVAFLIFMVPLPFRVEWALSVPLRHVATTVSCTTLQCLGQPAVAEGTTIILGEQELSVARECSGLRMLMGITALACAYIILVKKPWPQKMLLLASILPIAVMANVARVTLTALLYRYVSGEAAQTLSHDGAGLFTNCLAAVLFAAVLWCIHHLFLETESATGIEVLRTAETQPLT